MTTRAEHIAWCKARALAELDDDSDGQAVARAMASMSSDLRKHPDTAAEAEHGITGSMPVAVALAHLEAIAGVGMRTVAEARRWIEGFA
ncbi:hypothetical protein BJY24_004120 [Nocardia transvalensis]|uniref:Uncharacterized protein n=1 Tax=Nocardia transvalensis TaxID=37333 RepID=A0A7W9PGH7_9NOCA|nr:hypothetical protein [Nocardia transvalensis]MBB5915253.1 hypothetical protein [Nocardia transvalensis]